MPNVNDNTDLIREQVEQDRRWELTQRNHSILTIGVIALAAALAGLAWWAWPILSQNRSSLSALTGVKPAVDTLQNKMNDSNTQLITLQGNQQDLRGEMEKIGGELRSRLESAGRQTSASMSAMVRNVTSGINEGLTALRGRVSSLETERESDRQQIAGLQQDLTQVRGQLETDARELRAAQQQLAARVDDVAASSDRRMASLNEDQEHTRSDQRRDRADVDRIAADLSVERVPFEVSKGHTAELAPGVSLGLTKTNVLFHRADGWMWLMPDRRTIWLRGQSTQEPLTFYSTTDGRKRELVITQVTHNSVVGYLLLSKNPVRLDGGTEASADAEGPASSDVSASAGGAGN